MQAPDNETAEASAYAVRAAALASTPSSLELSGVPSCDFVPAEREGQ